MLTKNNTSALSACRTEVCLVILPCGISLKTFGEDLRIQEVKLRWWVVSAQTPGECDGP